MKTIKLSYNQELAVYHGKEVRITRNGRVMYIRKEDDGINAYTWTGTKWDDVKVISELN